MVNGLSEADAHDSKVMENKIENMAGIARKLLDAALKNIRKSAKRNKTNPIKPVFIHKVR